MAQYSTRLVVAHWLTLVLLITAWFLGEGLDEARHEASATLAGYIAHAAVGGAVLLLTLMRLLFRKTDGVPPAMGNTPMDKVAKGIHHSLYTILVLLPISGIVTMVSGGVLKAIQLGDAMLLPKKFSGVFAHEVHEVLVLVLMVLVAIHVLGALKHQFVMKDGIMERMSLRRK